MFDQESMQPWLKPQKAPFATYLLIAANIAVYIAMCVASRGDGIFQPSSALLLEYGANYSPFTLNHEEWRLFTCFFVHIGLIHLTMNMSVLFLIGRICEGLFGRIRYLLVYLLSGLGGSLLSVIANPDSLSAGASGAVLGLMGAFLAFVRTYRDDVGEGMYRDAVRSSLMYLAVCTIFGFAVHADHAGHFGGYIAGFLFGTTLVPVNDGKGKPLLDILVFLLLLGGMFGIYHLTWSGKLDWSGRVLAARAIGLQDLDKWKEAESLWRKRLDGFGPSKETYDGLTICREKLGDYKEALRFKKLAIEQGPVTDRDRQDLATLYYTLGDYRKVIEIESKILEKNRDFVQGRFLRACAWFEEGRTDAALAEFDKLEKDAADHPRLLAYGADMAMEGGRFEQAVRLGLLAEKDNPSDVDVLLILARSYAGLKDEKKAREYLARAERCDVDPRALIHAHFKMLVNLGRSGDALEYLQGEIGSYPKEFQLKYSLALLLYDTGRYADASRAAREAYGLADSPRLKAYLALFQNVCLGKAGLEQDRLALIRQTEPLVAGSGLFAESLIKYALDRISADELLKRASTQGDRTEAHAYIGFKLQQEGQTEQALDHFRFVAREGTRTFIEYNMARAELAEGQ
ncbi:MAG: rhomboid family intramembrane serine protease [Candidatus Melainabacteria bacterium]|nr:rhomboid family intramembrane serine protease [Candidatus Melainabacteria bacterium]